MNACRFRQRRASRVLQFGGGGGGRWHRYVRSRDCTSRLSQCALAARSRVPIGLVSARTASHAHHPPAALCCAYRSGHALPPVVPCPLRMRTSAGCGARCRRLRRNTGQEHEGCRSFPTWRLCNFFVPRGFDNGVSPSLIALGARRKRQRRAGQQTGAPSSPLSLFVALPLVLVRLYLEVAALRSAYTCAHREGTSRPSSFTKGAPRVAQRQLYPAIWVSAQWRATEG